MGMGGHEMGVGGRYHNTEPISMKFSMGLPFHSLSVLGAVGVAWLLRHMLLALMHTRSGGLRNVRLCMCSMTACKATLFWRDWGWGRNKNKSAS